MFKSAKKWLGLDVETHVGCLSKPITIFAHRNDKKLWSESASMPSGVISCSVFPDPPILYIIEGGNDAQFTFSTGERVLQCVFERNVNVYHNNCIVRQATPQDDNPQSSSFKVVLNYPVELVLAIPINQTIRIKGFWHDEVFHITALSNYPIY